MLKESDTKPEPPNSEKAILAVAEREYTMGWRLRKTALTTFALVFVFCLGFILSELRVRDQLKGIHFYVYDTEQKIEDYHKKMDKNFFNETGMSPESPEAKKIMAKKRTGRRPLVEVGPFFVFLHGDCDNSWFSVHEMPSMMLLAQLTNHEQSKELQLYSSVEKDWKFPRFRAVFRYSGDGVYEDGSLSVLRKDETIERIYFDTQEKGVFDAMYLYENGERFTYFLNGLTWEQEDTSESIDRLPEEE